jgi:hypothetical protein
MPRLFSLIALTALLATAAPLPAQAPVRPEIDMVGGRVIVLVERRILPPVHFIWPPVQNACSDECTLDLQYAAQVQSQTAFLKVFLSDDAFGLSPPDPLKTAPIPDLTGWRVSLAELGEASEQDLSNPWRHSDFPVRQDLNQNQVFNIAIGTQF